MVIHFSGKLILIGSERPSMVIFQLDVVQSCPKKLPLNSVGEKSTTFVTHARVLSFINQKMAMVAIRV
jgi:hypothetical protein